MNFLDIKLCVKADEICTSVYLQKLTVLKCGSSHPKSCKNAIPFSQFLRLKRQCSDRQDLKSEGNGTFLSTKRFSPEHYSKAKDRVLHISRADALKQKEPTKEINRVILTLTYNSHSKTLWRRIFTC